MDNKTILIIVISIIAAIGIGYFINDIYIKDYWDDRCEGQARSAAINASIITIDSIIQDYCDDYLIGYKHEDGTIEDITMQELCRRKG